MQVQSIAATDPITPGPGAYSLAANSPRRTPTPTPVPSPTPTPDPAANPVAPALTALGSKRGDFVIAPIPMFSPFYGGGLVLVAAYVFQVDRSDTISRPSTIGALVARTTSGTRGGIIGGQLYFQENKYQVTGLLGNGKIVGDFFGIGRIPGRDPLSARIEGKGTFVFVEGMRNFGANIFAGPRFQFRNLSFRAERARPPGAFDIPAIDIKSKSVALGFHVQRDTRDSTFYPRKGSLANVTGNFFTQALGSKRTYQTYEASFNAYKSLDKKSVLAYRGVVCGTDADTPFYDLCFFGGTDLRGYTTGRFQDRRMVVTQIEYRRELKWRIGAVAFAGVGETANRFEEFRFDRLLPAAGVGLRILLNKKHNINYRIDWGIGREGSSFTIGVSEAF
jgi:hypothetical protein